MQKVHIQHFNDTYFYVYVLPVLLSLHILYVHPVCLWRPEGSGTTVTRVTDTCLPQ